MSNPVLLAHNIIRLADLTPTSQELDHLVDDVFSDKRWEFWRPTSTALQTVEIFPAPGFQELLVNSDFETGLATEGWELDQGGGTATYTRNLVSPITGSADSKLDVTVFSGNVRILSERRYDLKKDVAVSLSWQAKTASGTINITAFILDEDGTTELAAVLELIGTSLASGFVRFTPSTDLEGVRFGLRVDAVSTTFIDDISATIDRAIDTLQIDARSRLAGSTIEIESKDDLTTAYSPVSGKAVNGVSGGDILNNNVQHVTFNARTAKYWRLTFDSLNVIPEVVGLYLGERFTFSQPPLGSLDPFGEKLLYNDQTGLHGDVARTYRGEQNRWTINLEIPQADRVVFDQFRDDIQRARFPFWLNWNPDLFPRAWKLYLIDSKRWDLPFEAGGTAVTWRQPIIEIGRERVS